MHVETAWQFLPSIRLDGYYILADLIGVPDLFAFVRPLLQSLLPGRRRAGAPTAGTLAQVKPRARRALVAWVALTVPSLVLGTVAVAAAAPRVVTALWPALLARLGAVATAARDGEVAAACVDVVGLLLLLLPVGGLLLTFAALARLMARKLTGTPASTGRPALPTIAGALALGVLPLLLLWRVARIAAATAGGHPRWALLGHRFTVPLPGTVLATAATAVLVGCFLTLARARRLPLAAAVLPLLAACALGPAATALTTGGQALAGAALLALGAVLLGVLARPATVVPGALAVVAGVVLVPLAAVPLAAGLTVLLARQRPGRHAAGGRGRAAGFSTWLAVAFAVAFGVVGTALAAVSPVPGGLDPAGRAVLLLVTALLVVAGAPLPRVRPLAAAAAALAVLAAVPSGSSAVAVAGLVPVAVLLAAELLAAWPTARAGAGVHPLVRVLVAVPVLVLVAVGALMVPGGAAPAQDAQPVVTEPAGR